MTVYWLSPSSHFMQTRKVKLNLSFLTYQSFSVKAIIWFLSSAGCLIFRGTGVLTGSVTLCCTGDCGCCCNPAAAEQSPSGDFMPPSISSFLHICVLWSPHHSSFSSHLRWLYRVLPLVFIGSLSIISYCLSSLGPITHTNKQYTVKNAVSMFQS